MTESSLNAYLEQIQSGKSDKAEARIIRYLMQNKFADSYELSQYAKCSVNTVGARMKTICCMGLAYQCGKKEYTIGGQKRQFTIYMFVEKPENRRKFGKVYRLEIAKARAQSIVNNAGEHSKNLAIRAQLEVEDIQRAIDSIMMDTPMPAAEIKKRST